MLKIDLKMKSAQVVSEILKIVASNAKLGINLLELESLASKTINQLNAKSANLGYYPKWAKKPYPSVICLGVNDIVAHGIPQDYVLKNGNLLSIDCGIKIDDQYGDAAMTIPIGKISPRDERLLRYAKRALYQGIKEVKAGIEVFQIGKAIDIYLMKMGFITNKNMLGHGIGKEMHEEPSIPMYWIFPEPLDSPVLKEGQIICIEPMVTYKDREGIRDTDGWTIRTKDSQKSAVFESMVKVTLSGFEILTNHINFNDCK